RLIVSQRLVPTADRSRLVAAAEILPSSISLFSLIRDNKTFQIPSLMQRGRAHGIVRLDDSLAELVRAGRVDVGSARAFAEAPDDFEAYVAQQRAAAQQPQVQPAPAVPGMRPKKRAPAEQAMDL